MFEKWIAQYQFNTIKRTTEAALGKNVCAVGPEIQKLISDDMLPRLEGQISRYLHWEEEHKLRLKLECLFIKILGSSEDLKWKWLDQLWSCFDEQLKLNLLFDMIRFYIHSFHLSASNQFHLFDRYKNWVTSSHHLIELNHVLNIMIANHTMEELSTWFHDFGDRLSIRHFLDIGHTSEEIWGYTLPFWVGWFMDHPQLKLDLFYEKKLKLMGIVSSEIDALITQKRLIGLYEMEHSDAFAIESVTSKSRL